MLSPSLSRFNEDGFAIVQDVLPESDILKLKEQLVSLQPSRSRAGIRHAMRYEAIVNVAGHWALLEIASQLLGAQASPFRATLFDKSPGANWLVVWHQDTALPLQERKEVPGWGPWSVKDGVAYAHAPTTALRGIVALRLHLDNSTAENGCLRVLPGSHKTGVLTDSDVERLVRELKAYDCLVPSGGILAMSPLLVHASSKSRVGRSRRVLHIEYAASPFVSGGLKLAVA